jgi:hypothetical protein
MDGAYSVARPMAPKSYLLERRSQRTSARGRLTAYDVAEIRRWSGDEGRVLSRAQQIRALSEAYGMSPKTLREILANGTWYDAAYVPSMTVTVPAEQAVLACGAGGRFSWMIYLLVLWTLMTQTTETA